MPPQYEKTIFESIDLSRCLVRLLADHGNKTWLSLLRQHIVKKDVTHVILDIPKTTWTAIQRPGTLKRRRVIRADEKFLQSIQSSIEAYTSRCSNCHKPISSDTRILLLDKTTLKSLCPKCVEVIILNKGQLGKCEFCGSPMSQRNIHHWWLPNDTITEYRYPSCPSCNSQFTIPQMWRGHPFYDILQDYDHILPTLELHYLFIQDRETYYKQRDTFYASIELAWPPKERDKRKVAIQQIDEARQEMKIWLSSELGDSAPATVKNHAIESLDTLREIRWNLNSQ